MRCRSRFHIPANVNTSKYICSRKHLGIFLKYCVKILPIYPVRRGKISGNLSDICGKYYAEVISGPDRGLFYLTTLQLAHRVSGQGQGSLCHCPLSCHILSLGHQPSENSSKWMSTEQQCVMLDAEGCEITWPQNLNKVILLVRRL